MNTQPVKRTETPETPTAAPGSRPDWRELPRRAGRLARYVVARFWRDNCLGTAASMSYTTLLAIVPLAAIGLAILAAFPVFETIQKDLQAFIFQTFLPETVDAVKDKFMGFLRNTSGLTALGIVGLAVTALLLLDTIEAAFNRIWRSKKNRPLAMRFLIYWGLITLGPLLLGGSMALSSYAFAMSQVVGEHLAGFWFRFVPFLLLWAGFTAAYAFVPNRRVHWSHALAGGLLAAALFEVLKRGFAYYVDLFPSYQTIYGALSVLPLSLVWMYCAWCAVLFGAQLAASLPEWRGGLLRTPADLLPPGRRLGLALGLLAFLHGVHRGGGSASGERVAAAVNAEPEPIAPILALLQRDRFIARTDQDQWVLSRDLGAASLFDLCSTLGLAMTGTMDMEPGTEPWRRRLADAWTAATEKNRETLGRSIESVLAGPGPGATARRRG